MGSSPRYSMYREAESKRLPESRAIRAPTPRRERLSAPDAPVSPAFPGPRCVETVADDASRTHFSPQRTFGVETAQIRHFAWALSTRELVLSDLGSNSSTRTGYRLAANSSWRKYPDFVGGRVLMRHSVTTGPSRLIIMMSHRQACPQKGADVGSAEVYARANDTELRAGAETPSKARTREHGGARVRAGSERRL